VALTLPGYISFKSGSIDFFSLPGGTKTNSVTLTAASLAGNPASINLAAGFYRAVFTVEVLGKRVAKTLIVHINDQFTTTADFDLAIGDFVPSPPAGGSVLYISTREELAAIRDHIASASMNYGKNAYVLLNDIALSGTWTPIGGKNDDITGTDWQYAFQGYFFGENHRITGLTLPNAASPYTGLFGVIHQALIQDLTVETVAARIMAEQRMDHYVGLVAGGSSESDLSNIMVKMASLTVKKNPAARNGSFGGLAGYVLNSRLRGITVTGVSGSSLSFETDESAGRWDPSIGGIAGHLHNFT
jgi:hypothetical protein